MAQAVHPLLQRRLLAAQAAASSQQACVEVAIEWLGGRCQAASALLALAAGSGRLPPERLLPELLAVSGAPGGLPGLLVWRCLAANLVTSGELLGLPAAAELLAEGVLGLHAALADLEGSPAGPSAQQHQAFAALAKLMATCAEAEHSRRIVEAAARTLRSAWGVAAPGGPAAPPGQAARGLELEGPAGGVQLLARLVRMVHREVFPRELATRWLEAELAAVLQSQHACAPDGSPPGLRAAQQQRQQQQRCQRGAAAAAAGGSSWPEAMAAFVAALPLDALLGHVQQAVQRWCQHPGAGGAGAAAGAPAQQHQLLRCGELLLAAGGASAQVATAVGAWVRAHAAAGVQGRDALLVRSMLLLQRQLCGTAQQYQAWLGAALLGQSAGAGGAGGGDLQFVLQQVLLPLLPDEEDAELLEAQRSAVEALHDLPASAARAVQDYREGARQRLHALHKQQREQGQGQQREAHGAGAKEGAAAGGGGAAGAAAGLSVAAPGTVATGAAAAAGPGFQTARDRELGLQQAAALVAEFRQHGGTRLPAATLQRLEERWSNVFSRNGVQGQLLPALLLPESEPAAAEERTALLEHLFHNLPPKTPLELRRRFGPAAVAAFRERSALVQLDSAPLGTLAERLATAAAPAGAGGAHGVGPHQLLDRMGMLVGQHVAAAVEQADQDTALPALLDTLINAFASAYAACALESSSSQQAAGGGGAASAAALAAHLLDIIHRRSELHGPLLRRVEWLVLESGPVGQLDAQQALSLAMLCSTMGAFLSSQPLLPGSRQQPTASPLFVWRGAAATGAGAAGGGEQPGPLWLQRLLQRLPLRGAAGAAWACRFAAALLSCLRHFDCYLALEPLGPFQQAQHDAAAAAAAANGAALGGRVLPHRRCRRAGEAAAYDGEWVRRLVFPLCIEAVRLLQWAQLRLGVASLLLGEAPDGLGPAATAGDQQGSDPALLADGEEGQGRQGKRPRLQQAWAGGGGRQLAAAQQIQQLCRSVLGGELGETLAGEAGPLRLGEFLQLEAAAAAAARGAGYWDLVPALYQDAVLRAVCSHYLSFSLPPAQHAQHAQQGPQQPPEGAPPLPQLRPLLLPAGGPGPLPAKQGGSGGAAAAGTGSSGGRQSEEEVAAMEFVPDSEDEDGAGWTPRGGLPSAPLSASSNGGSGGGRLGGSAAGSSGAGALVAAVAEEVGHALLLAAAVGLEARGAAAAEARLGGAPLQEVAAACSPGAALSVLQAAAGHLLQLAQRQVGSTAAAAAAQGGEPASGLADCAGGSSTVELLARFLLGLLRACQRGMPARAAAPGGPYGVPTPNAAGQAAVSVLRFEPQALARVSELAGALSRGLWGELLVAQRLVDAPLELAAACARQQALAAAVQRGLADFSPPDTELLVRFRQAMH